jgi:hypothetical protein
LLVVPDTFFFKMISILCEVDRVKLQNNAPKHFLICMKAAAFNLTKSILLKHSKIIFIFYFFECFSVL